MNEYSAEIMQRLSPERQECIKSLIEQTRITRSRPKPMPVPSADKGYGRYASPVLYGTPVMVLLTAAKAQEVLSRCRMFPRQNPMDEEKLQDFITRIQSGQWIVSKLASLFLLDMRLLVPLLSLLL